MSFEKYYKIKDNIFQCLKKLNIQSNSFPSIVFTNIYSYYLNFFNKKSLIV